MKTALKRAFRRPAPSETSAFRRTGSSPGAAPEAPVSGQRSRRGPRSGERSGPAGRLGGKGGGRWSPHGAWGAGGAHKSGGERASRSRRWTPPRRPPAAAPAPGVVGVAPEPGAREHGFGRGQTECWSPLWCGHPSAPSQLTCFSPVIPLLALPHHC